MRGCMFPQSMRGAVSRLIAGAGLIVCVLSPLGFADFRVVRQITPFDDHARSPASPASHSTAARSLGARRAVVGDESLRRADRRAPLDLCADARGLQRPAGVGGFRRQVTPPTRATSTEPTTSLRSVAGQFCCGAGLQNSDGGGVLFCTVAAAARSSPAWTTSSASISSTVASWAQPKCSSGFRSANCPRNELRLLRCCYGVGPSRFGWFIS